MQIVSKTIEFKVWKIIGVVIFCLALLLCAIQFYLEDIRLIAMAGGISAGLLTYLIDFFLSVYQSLHVEKIRNLKIIDVLHNRDSREYYGAALSKAKKQIDVIGTSCNRFIEHFARQSSAEHVVLDALRRHQRLEIRLLVPSDKFMDDGSRQRFDLIAQIVKDLQTEFPGRFSLRRFDTSALHSLVRIDDEIIVGPIFPERQSRDTPAIHFHQSSVYAQPYSEYFDAVWKKATPFA